MNREAETMTRLDTDSKGKGEDNSAPCVIFFFFPLRKFHVWLESSRALRPAHLFITALNRRAVKEKECSLCLRTRPRVSFLCLCSPASFVPSSLRPHTRRERACRVARCIYLNRPGNCAFNISELFPRRKRALRVHAI